MASRKQQTGARSPRSSSLGCIRSFLTGTGSNSLDGWGLVNYLFLPTSFYLLYAESHTTIFGFHVSALRCYSPGCVHCKLFCRKYKSVDSSKSRYRYCQSLKLFDFHGFSHVNASGLLWLLGQSRSQQIPLLLIIAIYSSFQEMNALVWKESGRRWILESNIARLNNKTGHPRVVYLVGTFCILEADTINGVGKMPFVGLHLHGSCRSSINHVPPWHAACSDRNWEANKW